MLLLLFSPSNGIIYLDYYEFIIIDYYYCFNYVDIEEVDSSISEEHKNMVREIKLHTKIEDFIDADTFMNNLEKELI